MKIGVFGVGYVGLVTGVCFSEMGNSVIGVDIDPKKIALLNDGKSPIYEPGLDDLLKANIESGRIHFTNDSSKAIDECDVLFIAVGTPSDVDGSADLKYVSEVAKTIARRMTTKKYLVIKSTVPVGTSKLVADIVRTELKIRNSDLEFEMISNPEFLKEGTAIEDCLKPSRIVVGVSSKDAEEKMQDLYEAFVKNGHPIIVMDIVSAELTKYAANSLLATKISFMNELSRVCEKVGADVEKIRIGIGSDPRIGKQFIYPGVGFGGSCFPKDLRALIQTGRKTGDQLHILEAVLQANQIQRERFIEKIVSKVKGTTVAVWGLAFKPGTDDVREAPSLDVIASLLRAGCVVNAFDPIAKHSFSVVFKEMECTDSELAKLHYVKHEYDALPGASALVILTEWKQFREPDFDRLKKEMKSKLVFDGRNLYSPEKMKRLGFEYYSIGR